MGSEAWVDCTKEVETRITGGSMPTVGWEVWLGVGSPKFIFAPFFVPMAEAQVMGGLSKKKKTTIILRIMMQDKYIGRG